MSIIIGTMTRFECDMPYCSEESLAHFDQSAAFDLAIKNGWSHSDKGLVICPKCRWGRDGKDGEMIGRLNAEINRLRNEVDFLKKDNEKFLREIHQVDHKEADTVSQCPHCGGKVVS